MIDLDIHKYLRNVWEETPLSVKVPKDDFKLLSQENRGLILKALNTGLYESKYDYLRHILTAQEILDYIQKNHNEDFKLTNVYFHLQKLQEKNFIKEVTQIGTGKRPKTFYGRTAKIFVNSDSMEEDLENDPFYQKLFQIIHKLNPSISESKIKEPFNKINNLKWDKQAKTLESWFNKNKDILDEIDIDYTRLFLYLNYVLDFGSDYIPLNKELADMFLLKS